MANNINLIVEPLSDAIDLISLEFLKKALRIDDEGEDELLKHYLEAAISSAEKFLGIALRNQKVHYTTTLDFDGRLKIPIKPFISLRSLCIFYNAWKNDYWRASSDNAYSQEREESQREYVEYYSNQLDYSSYEITSQGNYLLISRKLISFPHNCKLKISYFAGPLEAGEIPPAIIQGIIQHVSSLYEAPEIGSIPRGSLDCYKLFREYKL